MIQRRLTASAQAGRAGLALLGLACVAIAPAQDPLAVIPLCHVDPAPAPAAGGWDLALPCLSCLAAGEAPNRTVFGHT